MATNETSVSVATTKTRSSSNSSAISSTEHNISVDIQRRFKIGKKLGCGSFGHVYLAVDRETNRKYAMKHIQIHARIAHYYQYFDFEVTISKELDHENVLRCLEAFTSGKEIHMLFDVMEGGNLFELLQRQGNLSEDLAKFYFKQLCSSIEYIHGKNIVHCDIKTENLLRSTDDTRPVLKLCDFGLSRKFDVNNSVTTKHGALLYAAPELLVADPFSPKVDIWSAGVTLYVMLSAKLPFNSSAAIRKGNCDFEGNNFDNVSKPAKQLVQKMLAVDPETRLSIEDISSIEWVQ